MVSHGISLIEHSRPSRFRQGYPRRSLEEIELERNNAIEAYKQEFDGPGAVPLAGTESTRDKPRKDASIKSTDDNALPPLSIEEQRRSTNKPRIALTSAYRGERYDYMARLSGETKIKYSKMHGYTFFEDNHLIPEKSTWHQRSAIRTRAFMEHIDDFDWIYWSDVDIFITNPQIAIEDLIRQGHGAHIICSKDWGGRQVNPGSMLVKSSQFTRDFIKAWEDAILEVSDDLIAFQKIMTENPEWEHRKVRFIPQSAINPYHHVETSENGQLVLKPLPDKNGHDLWTEDSLLVHIVNCLRTSRGDCHILADYFYRIAEYNFAQAGYPLESYLS